MSQRQAITQQVAIRYRSASKGSKKQVLDELCATTGWHRDHARKALRQALGPRPVGKARRKPAAPRPLKYGPEVIAALRTVWAVMDAPAGKRMAPFMGEIVERLRACGELDISDETAALLCSMSAATIDRRLAPGPEETADQRTLGHEARHAAQGADPDQDLGGLGRGRAGCRRDRLRGPRGRRPRGSCCGKPVGMEHSKLFSSLLRCASSKRAGNGTSRSSCPRPGAHARLCPHRPVRSVGHRRCPVRRR